MFSPLLQIIMKSCKVLTSILLLDWIDMRGYELVGLTDPFEAFLKLLIVMCFQETLHHPLKFSLVISNRVKDVPCLNVLQIKVVRIVSS